MHWWGKNDKNLRENRTGGLTRFVYRRPTPEAGNDVVGGFTTSWWIGKHGSADRIPVAVPEVGDRGGGEEFESLAKMRTKKVGEGLRLLDEGALQTQMAVMQKAVTQNYQKADGALLQPEDVELTMWWSARRNVAGLWLVGTLKELKEAVEDSFRADPDQEYVKALQMDTRNPVRIDAVDDAPATISFVQAPWDGKFHVESRPYSETDSTRYVLYSAGTGEHKNLTLMSYETFAAERTLRHKTEPTKEKMPSRVDGDARSSW